MLELFTALLYDDVLYASFVHNNRVATAHSIAQLNSTIHVNNLFDTKNIDRENDSLECIIYMHFLTGQLPAE